MKKKKKPLYRKLVRVPPSSVSRNFGWRFYWAIGTLVLAGSLFFLSSKGLPAFVTSLGTFLSGWWTLSDVPIWRPLLALPAYEILPLALGIAAAVRAILKQDTLSLRLAIWALVALLLALVYPGKQTGDLVWALLPLWVLAALELGPSFRFCREQSMGSGCHLWGGICLCGFCLAQPGQHYEYGFNW